MMSYFEMEFTKTFRKLAEAKEQINRLEYNLNLAKAEIFKLKSAVKSWESMFEEICGDLDKANAELNKVVAAERERCAKLVEQYTGAWDDEGFALAAAIRKGE